MCLKPVTISSFPTHFCARCRVRTLSRVSVFQAVSYFSSVEHKGELDLKALNRENSRSPVSRGLQQGITSPMHTVYENGLLLHTPSDHSSLPMQLSSAFGVLFLGVPLLSTLQTDHISLQTLHNTDREPS